MTLEEMRQILEALVSSTGELHLRLASPIDVQLIKNHKAIKLLEKAIAEAEEQKPVGRFARFTDGIWREVTDGSPGQPLYAAPQPKQEQGEPVAWMQEGQPELYVKEEKDEKRGYVIPLYTHPQPVTTCSGCGESSTEDGFLATYCLKCCEVVSGKQKPIGYISDEVADDLVTKNQAYGHIKNYMLFNHDVPVYTHPQPKREWVELTDEQIEFLWANFCKKWKKGPQQKIIINCVEFARAIEAAHGIKENT